MKLPAILLTLLLSSCAFANAEAPRTHAAQVEIEISSPSPASPQPNRHHRARIDFKMSVVRTGVAALGLLVFTWGLLPTHQRGWPSHRVRKRLLVILALMAYASYYQFFLFGHSRGFATSDNFHYYLGSKYFPELGYFGLYECSLTALTERGLPPVTGQDAKIRDLTSMRIEPATKVADRGRDCPERFGPERWRSFGDDVEFFVRDWPKHIRHATWLDHGYHPSPSWTLVGGLLAQNTQVGESSTGYLLARLDRVLIAATLIGIAWAFGLETACLVTLIWGTGFLWRYSWVGDAFLRHLWWIAAMCGVIALRRGLHGRAGSALALSTLFRIFPASLGIGYLAHAVRTTLREGRLQRKHYLFALGAGFSFVLVSLLSAWTSGQGLLVYQEFSQKLSEFAAIPISNDVGLGVLTYWLFPTSNFLSGMIQALMVATFVLLFWRALGNIEDWEATAAGALLIPIVADPANYYLSFFAIVALTAKNRPRIGIILLVTSLLLNVNGVLLYQEYREFDWASAITVISCFAVILQLGRPDQNRPELSTTT